MSALALDTSVAVPLLVRSHPRHDAVVAWLARRTAALSGHALPETYSVLTRLPGGARLAPLDAARLLRERFAAALTLDARRSATLAETLSAVQVAGGAVYDAMVALAALDHGAELATRDARAVPTYEAIGVAVIHVA